ncbi:hypothetical protein IWX48DRAFT_592102 [Phyllosticta citricarpa]
MCAAKRSRTQHQAAQHEPPITHLSLGITAATTVSKMTCRLPLNTDNTNAHIKPVIDQSNRHLQAKMTQVRPSSSSSVSGGSPSRLAAAPRRGVVRHVYTFQGGIEYVSREGREGEGENVDDAAAAAAAAENDAVSMSSGLSSPANKTSSIAVVGGRPRRSSCSSGAGRNRRSGDVAAALPSRPRRGSSSFAHLSARLMPTISEEEELQGGAANTIATVSSASAPNGDGDGDDNDDEKKNGEQQQQQQQQQPQQRQPQPQKQTRPRRQKPRPTHLSIITNNMNSNPNPNMTANRSTAPSQSLRLPPSPTPPHLMPFTSSGTEQLLPISQAFLDASAAAMPLPPSGNPRGIAAAAATQLDERWREERELERVQWEIWRQSQRQSQPQGPQPCQQGHGRVHPFEEARYQHQQQSCADWRQCQNQCQWSQQGQQQSQQCQYQLGLLQQQQHLQQPYQQHTASTAAYGFAHLTASPSHNQGYYNYDNVAIMNNAVAAANSGYNNNHNNPQNQNLNLNNLNHNLTNEPVKTFPHGTRHRLTTNNNNNNNNITTTMPPITNLTQTPSSTTNNNDKRPAFDPDAPLPPSIRGPPIMVPMMSFYRHFEDLAHVRRAFVREQLRRESGDGFDGVGGRGREVVDLRGEGMW